MRAPESVPTAAIHMKIAIRPRRGHRASGRSNWPLGKKEPAAAEIANDPIDEEAKSGAELPVGAPCLKVGHQRILHRKLGGRFSGSTSRFDLVGLAAQRFLFDGLIIRPSAWGRRGCVEEAFGGADGVGAPDAISRAVAIASACGSRDAGDNAEDGPSSARRCGRCR